MMKRNPALKKLARLSREAEPGVATIMFTQGRECDPGVISSSN